MLPDQQQQPVAAVEITAIEARVRLVGMALGVRHQ
jgi:hypothetical protein